MKKIYALTLLLSVGLILHAQTGSKIFRIDDSKGEHYRNEIQKVFGQKWSDWNRQYRLVDNELYQNKSFSTTKKKMDSVISETFDRLTLQWVKDEKEFYEYDNQGFSSRNSSFSWDAGSDDWLGYDMQETSFDSNGNLTLQVDYYWEDSGNKWVPSTKHEHVYEDGVIRYDLDYNWDDAENNWVSDGVWTYEYTDGLLSSLTLTGVDLNYDGIVDRLDGIKIIYSYDNQGYLILELTYIYVDDDIKWMEYYRAEYTYDSNNRMATIILSMPDPISQVWTYFMKVGYSYDATGNQSAEALYTWEPDGGTWTLSYLDEYVYTANGSLESITSSYHNSEIGEMVTETKRVFTHNEDYSLNDLVVPYLIPAGYFRHMVTGYSFYEFSNGSWTITDRGTIYYSDFQSSGIHKFELSTAKVYPNPASGLVTFDGSNLDSNTTVSFYDSYGRLVNTVRLPESRQIPVYDLPVGMYFYQIQTGSSLIKGKLIIQ